MTPRLPPSNASTNIATASQWTAEGLDGEWALIEQLIPEFLNAKASTGLTIVGIDEAGRGCVAGPVVAAAVAVQLAWQAQTPQSTLESAQLRGCLWQGVRDSKRLSAQRRELIAAQLGVTITSQMRGHADVAAKGATPKLAPPTLVRPKTHHHVAQPNLSLRKSRALPSPASRAVVVGVHSASGAASCGEIEAFNIWQATQVAIARALVALPKVDGPCVLFFDGRLACKLPAAFAQSPLITMVKGDDHLRSIGAASIVAKVTRDRFMTELDSTFPDFGFAKHKGYGTASHFEALSKVGPSPQHRLSFLSRVLGN